MNRPFSFSPPRPGLSGWLDPQIRGLVLSQLDRLDGGTIRVSDALGTVVIGRQTVGSVLAADLHVHDLRFYRLLATKGSLGAAEAFRNGMWESDDLTKLGRLMVRRIGRETAVERSISRLLMTAPYLAHRFRRNDRVDSRRNISAHYDLGNEFFELFLDPSMTYSCGIFESPDASMEEASMAKLKTICDKLELGPKTHVLEIGSGWGSFALYAATHYGCRVTTTTISKEQHRVVVQRVCEADLSGRVTPLLLDFRDLEGQFDSIASIEMIEAIGDHNLRPYFAQCSKLLKPGGLMALQAITMADQCYRRYLKSVDFIRHDVFPGACCPSRTAMLNAVTEASDLRLVGLEEIGPHYATTLARWRMKFFENLDQIRALGCPEEFLRLWHFYLAYCEAGFAEGHTGNVQMLLRKTGLAPSESL